MKTRVR